MDFLKDCLQRSTTKITIAARTEHIGPREVMIWRMTSPEASSTMASVTPVSPSTAWMSPETSRVPSSLRRMPSTADQPTSSQRQSASATMCSAILSLLLVLRNAGVSILVAWLFGYSFSVGNIFSGHSPSQQSYASFVAANNMWFIVLFSVTIVAIGGVKLAQEEFIPRTTTVGTQPTRKASSSPTPRSRRGGSNLTTATRKLVRQVWPHVLLAVISAVVFARFAAQVAPRFRCTSLRSAGFTSWLLEMRIRVCCFELRQCADGNHKWRSSSKLSVRDC
jgi:hypothetical protein